MKFFWMVQAVESNGRKWLSGFRLILIAAGLLLLSIEAAAQEAPPPPLERVVTISFYQEKLDVVLSKLSREGKFTFSYNPAILDVNGAVSGSFIKKTIREILNQLFNGKIQFKQRGNYIILTRSAATPSDTRVESLVITGYVLHAESGEKLPEVSIYDRKTFSAAVSNEYGFFKLTIDDPLPENSISINKKNFRDTIVMVSRGAEKFINFSLVPERIVVVDTLNKSDPIPVRMDSLDSTLYVKFPEEQKDSVTESEESRLKKSMIKAKRWVKSKINMLNIRDSLHRKFQVSFLPFLGTNHKLSGNVINDYSFNILGGYSLGTEKFEIGGLFNIDRSHVKKVQLAGIFNVVGGKMSGAQLAGIFNFNNKEVKATQLAGIANFNGSSVHGIQLAGIVNANYGQSSGMQLAGIANIQAKKYNGPQLAGIGNFSFSGVHGFQLAGLINATFGDSKGMQLAGLANFQVKNYQGSQVSGLFNIATHKITGSQISGLLNIGGKVRGTQIGLINIVDSIRGVPVGLMSLVWQGYHKIEISADEIFYTNVAFRTGVHQFYNIFSAGIKPNNFNDPVWTIGYGVGTAPRLSRWLYLNVDLTSNYVERGHFESNDLNLLNKLYAGVDFQLLKKFSITMGVTLNAYLTKRNNTESFNLFSDYSPTVFSTTDWGNNLRMQRWWGAKVGIRFL